MRYWQNSGKAAVNSVFTAVLESRSCAEFEEAMNGRTYDGHVEVTK